MPTVNLQQVQTNAQARILRRKAVEDRTGLPRSTIYAMMGRGEFPSAISLGAKSVGWLESSVENWIASRVAASRPTSAE